MSRDIVGSLRPFLPSSLTSRTPPGRLPHARVASAGLLFADISGFTALTEKLQQRGREGAEEIASVISAAFAPAIRAIEKHHGSIDAFGGDALFATFADPGGAARVAGAAAEIARAFEKRGEVATSAGSVRLGISQAVHHGQVSNLHLGTRDRRHYLVTGAAVAALAKLEARASGGKLLLSVAAKREVTRGRGVRQRTQAARPPTLRELRTYLPPRLPALKGFEGEYRKVAVLFLETRGQAVAALQGWYLYLCQVLDRYDGLLLKTDLSASGTKWICLFGVPQAHEEDPDRAARAALDVLGRIPRGLVVRGGLHGGVVANIVVGSKTRRSFDVMGDAVNTAARALARAKWGEVLITDGVRRQLSGVETRSRGKHEVKGIEQALHLHALVSARAIQKPIRVSAPMIGRDAELRQIVKALENAKAGQGGTIGIKGEPGLGKSRLKYEAAKVARQMGFEVHEGRAISFGGMAYWTIGALLKDALGLAEVPNKDDVLAKVTAAAERLGMKAVDRHHLADVLGARYPDSPIEHLQPKDIRLNAMIATREFCQALAKLTPRLLVLEDMHWADGASAEAAEWLTKGAVDMPYVVLLLYRPGYEPPHVAARIELGDLASDAVGDLLEAHLGVVPEKVGKLVRERAGGNPFYVEEVVRHLLEAGILALSDEGYQLVREPTPADLPESVETVIAARLDRLSPPARSVAQHGAVIGRSFSFELLAGLPGLAAMASRGVRELAAREIVFPLGRSRRREYVFKHALTRDVAYSSVLMSRRRRMHAAVAAAIERAHDEQEQFQAMLGHHWEHAAQGPKARRCYLAAARQAARRYAQEEAERLYQRYLALVTAPTAESIAARNELGENVLLLQGRMRDANVEHRKAVREARTLRDKVLEARGLGALASIHEKTGRMTKAEGLYRRAIVLARAARDRQREGVLLGGLGVLLEGLGRMDEAERFFRQALRIHRSVGNRPFLGHVLCNLAGLDQIRGRPREARALYEKALDISRELANRWLEGIVLANLASLRQEAGQQEEARDIYEEALRVIREVGDRRIEGIVTSNLALLLADMRQEVAAVELYRQALASHGEAGNRASQGVTLANLASLRRCLGEIDEARALYQQALDIAREVGDRRIEGFVLGSLAEIGLFHGVDGAQASRLLEEGSRLLAAIGDRNLAAKLFCAWGHVALANGSAADERISAAHRCAAELGAGPRSELGQSIARIERAIAALVAGRSLLCGYAPEDITPGQLRWLREHRPEAIPPEVMARLDENGALPPETPSAG